MVFYPDPNNSPATRNAKINYFSQIYLYYRISLNYEIYTYTIISPIYRKYSYLLSKNSLSSFQLLNPQYTLLTSTIYPATTHLSQVTLYNPVTQQKVVTYVNNYRCFANYSVVRSTSANFHKSLRENTQYRNDSVLYVDVYCEVTQTQVKTVQLIQNITLFFRDSLKRKLFSEKHCADGNSCSLQTKHCG